MNVFVSYRRSDCRPWVERLCDRLVDRFGRAAIFKDLDSISPGSNFKQQLRGALENCEFFVPVIGPGWLAMNPSTNRPRLWDSDDFVRMEMQFALEANVRTIPILVDGATFPRQSDLPEALHSIIDLQAAEIRADPHFHRDVDRLIGLIACRALEKLALTADAQSEHQGKGIQFSEPLIEMFNEKIASNPTRYEAYVQRGQTYTLMASQPGGKGFWQALQDYQRAIELASSASDPHFGIGTVYFRLALWDLIERKLYTIHRPGALRINPSSGKPEMFPPAYELRVDDRSKLLLRACLDEYELGQRLRDSYYRESDAISYLFAPKDVQDRMHSTRALLGLTEAPRFDEWLLQVFSQSISRGDASAFGRLFPMQ